MLHWFKVTLRRLWPVIGDDGPGRMNYRLSREALAGLVKMVIGGLAMAGKLPGLEDPDAGATAVVGGATAAAAHLQQAIELIGGLFLTMNGWTHVNRRHREHEEKAGPGTDYARPAR